MSFRYALNTMGDVSLGSMERINIAWFAELMERHCTSLEAIAIITKEMPSGLEDMYRDYSLY